ncbi:MAG: hypothetical protein RLZZ15_3700 [Verrucomicrobiota bacterium]|jgi:curli biogenesis system outer membrane secretion channel CsgG
MNRPARLRRLALFGSLLAITVPAAEPARDAKPTAEIIVAVIDFDNPSGQNLPGIGRVAHDVLNTHLVGLPAVSVVTRDKLGAVLKEQDLAASGLIGNRAKSTQFGQLLGADYMVTGAVLNYGVDRRDFGGFGIRTVTVFHRMKVSLQIVDLTTARLSFAKTYDLEYRDPSASAINAHGYLLAGRERDLLANLIQQAGDDLRTALVAHTGAVPLGKQFKISVTSVPPGADIELNGLYVGTTPAEIEMEEGVQSLRVLLSGYRPWEKRLKVTADLKVSPALAPLPPEEKITIEQKRSK